MRLGSSISSNATRIMTRFTAGLRELTGVGLRQECVEFAEAPHLRHRRGRAAVAAGGDVDARHECQCRAQVRCAAVEQCASDGHVDAMVLAASETFLALEGWLQGSVDAPIP